MVDGRSEKLRPVRRGNSPQVKTTNRMAPRTLFEKIWDAHLVREDSRAALPDLHRPASDSRRHFAAGVRRIEGRRAQSAPAGADVRGDGPFRLDQESPAAGARCGRRRRSSKRWRAIAKRPACTSSTCTARIRASCTSSGRSWASRSRGRRSSAATATLRRMARSARWRSASAPAKSSTCSRRSASRNSNRRRWRFDVQGKRPRGVTVEGYHSRRHRQNRNRAAAMDTLSNTPAKRCAAFRWKRRMTMCNMTIEGGARAGMVAPDDTTFAYLEGRPFVPRGKEFQDAVSYWKSLATRSRCEIRFDRHAASADSSRRWSPGERIREW